MAVLPLAFRRLRLDVPFSLAVVLTIGLGAGANTLVFSAVYGLLLRPLPFPASEELLWVFGQGGSETLTDQEARAVASRASALAHVAVIGDRGFVRAVDGRHQRWRGLWVTPALLDVLGVRPLAGRGFVATDAAAAVQPMLISGERWRRDFAQDPGLIGRELVFEDNKRAVVVGILPEDLQFPFGTAPRSGNGTGFVAGVQDFWVLDQGSFAELPGGFVLARLRPGLTLKDAAAQVAALRSATDAAAAMGSSRRLVPVSMREQVLGPLGQALGPLQVFALLVALLACVNIAMLAAIRAARRRADVAVQRALGAGPSHLLWPAVADAAILSVLGSALAIFLAWGGRRWLTTTISEAPALMDRVRFDAVPLLAALAVGLVAAAVLSVVPLVNWRAVLAGPGSRNRSVTGRSRPLGILVVAQVTLSTLLLLGAVALHHSLYRLVSVDMGYRSTQVLTADTLLFVPNAGQGVVRARERLLRIPGVEAVGLTHSTPLTGTWVVDGEITLTTGGVSRTLTIPGGFVAFDYFEAMNVPLLAGRRFTDAEFLASDAPVVMLNDAAARRLFGERNPVGERVRMFGRDREVIGIVKGTRDVRLELAADPRWYQPMLFGSSHFVIRTAGDPAELIEAVTAELRAADSRMIVNRVAPLQTIIASSIVDKRLAAQLVTAFAVIALALAMIGLFAVVHMSVAARVRELGIRLALGATRSRIALATITTAVTLAIAGTVAASAAWTLTAGALQHFLFEVSATDWRRSAAAALTLLVTALLASAVPAWRAATVDPMQVLRRD